MIILLMKSALPSRYCLEGFPTYMQPNRYDVLTVARIIAALMEIQTRIKSLRYVLVHKVNNYRHYALYICPVRVSCRGSCHGNRIVLYARFEIAFTTP